MKNFFSSSVLKKIKQNESDPLKIKNFLSQNEVQEILKYKSSLSKKMVDREESTKIPFDWSDSEILKNLKNKIEEITGEFKVKDFEPHFITTRFPLRLHADTGKDPNDIIFKNIVVPLEINYKNNVSKNKSHTIIFKNKWYERSALFTTKTKEDYDFIIKDYNNNFIDIVNIHDFKKEVEKTKKDQFLNYKKNKFFIDEKFKDYIDMLSKTKRYNLRTASHIVNDKDIDIKVYEKYMTHQPYDDCKSLEIDKAFSWEPGNLLVWDRVRIHCSDNFLKNGIDNKTCIALFSSK